MRLDELVAELRTLRRAVRMAKLELGSHGACPACINAHTILTRAADALEPSGDVVERIVKEALSVATYGTPAEIAVQIAHNAVRAAIAALGASHAE